jgi:hypothetical protein
MLLDFTAKILLHFSRLYMWDLIGPTSSNTFDKCNMKFLFILYI